MVSLTDSEYSRYAAQLKLLEVGIAGQLKLKQARVLCVGAGGLGSSLLLYLAAAGIGTLGIVDDDVVELSNLPRQVLYQETQLGQKKVVIAQQQLTALNPALTVNIYPERLERHNAIKILSEYDLIADCSDNFATRYLINQSAYSLNKPSVFAAVSGFEGQCAIFLGQKTPCLRCLFPLEITSTALPTCIETGILGPLPGLLGLIQAMELLKYLLNVGESLAGKLLVVDLLRMKFQKIAFYRNEECAHCRHSRESGNLTRLAPAT